MTARDPVNAALAGQALERARSELI